MELRATVSAGKAAAERGDWHAVGTANMHFHQAIAGLADYLERAEEQLVQAYADADRAPVTA